MSHQEKAALAVSGGYGTNPHTVTDACSVGEDNRDVKTNPIATADQAAIERRALEVLAHPLVKATVEEVRKAWPELVKPSADMMKAFEWAFDEVVYAAVIWSLNTDKERPKVITI